MKIKFICRREEFLHTVEDIVRIFYPRVNFVDCGQDGTLVLDYEDSESVRVFAYFFVKGKKLDGDVEEEFNQDEERDNQLRRAARLAVYRALRQNEETASPWGVLTGVRPTKIVHRFMDKGRIPEEIERELIRLYAVTPEKARLLINVALVQRPFLPQGKSKKYVSIYIGIPFCPTRCAYCSFSAEPLGSSAHLVEPYLKALEREMAETAGAVRNLGISVDTVYLGGGTPTSLGIEDFEQLLSVINRYFICGQQKEFTVEAGRPDTLDREKFLTMKKWSVNRVSINPQTMHQRTLNLIRRNHSVEEAVKQFYQARDLGFTINMDLILGLPDETPEHVKETMEKIGALAPENLTVHTLAVKRNSLINRERESFHLAGTKEVERMVEISRHQAEEMGMYPYYLYRQKNILGKLENTGYCSMGKECLYNINIIEERQTIIGLGVGAGSKFVDDNRQLEAALYNPKDITCYLERFDRLIKKKIDKLESIVYNE